jgi:hypothetical protein
MSGTTVETATEIRPFTVEVSEEELNDLRRRIAATPLARTGNRPRRNAGQITT